jgi:hypothetical protein
LQGILVLKWRSKWTTKQLEDDMNIVERGITLLKGANKFFNILLSSLSAHLIGKVRSKKVGLHGVFTKEEEGVVIDWILGL